MRAVVIGHLLLSFLVLLPLAERDAFVILSLHLMCSAVLQYYAFYYPSQSPVLILVLAP
jgi:hypothetical protein